MLTILIYKFTLSQYILICNVNKDCEVELYCDNSNFCDKCTTVTTDYCNSVDNDCCSTEFLYQCENNPYNCQISNYV